MNTKHVEYVDVYITLMFDLFLMLIQVTQEIKQYFYNLMSFHATSSVSYQKKCNVSNFLYFVWVKSYTTEEPQCNNYLIRSKNIQWGVRRTPSASLP